MQEEQNDVVILFCDICDFDKIIASKGRHIVEILDELFRKYDGICLNNGLQKIEVIEIICSCLIYLFILIYSFRY